MQLAKRDDSDLFPGNAFVKELIPSDFVDGDNPWQIKNNGCVAVLFGASWCRFCQETKPVWIEFAKKAAYVDVYSFNCEKYKTHLEKLKRSSPGKIKGYPTIIFFSHGEPVKNFEEERTLANLLKTSMSVCKPNGKSFS
jgi:thiol-disulfide isomerase/thioredoxin